MGLQGGAAADAAEFPALQHAEQLRLHGETHLADFVEKQGAPARLLETSGAAVGRARERPALVPEELALEEVLRDRGAVDLDEGLPATRAALVDGLGDQLFAGARFAENEHAAVAARDRAHHVEDGFHRGVLADHASGLGRRRRLALRGENFAQPRAQFLRGHGFLEIVGHTEPGCLDGGLFVAATGDHHDGDRAAEPAHAADHLEAAQFLHHERGDQQIRRFAPDLAQCPQRAGADRDFAAMALQARAQFVQEGGDVVDDQDAAVREGGDHVVRQATRVAESATRRRVHFRAVLALRPWHDGC